MRDELHLMDLVDRYLDGSMNETDRKAFEARAEANAELRQLIEDQRALREGVQRVPLRAAAAKAYRAYRFGKPGPWVGGAAVVAIIVASSLFLARHGNEQSFGAATSIANDEGSIAMVLPDTAGTGLSPLVMEIDPNADTTLLTPNGLVLDIPKGAFVDGLGRAITTPVRVTMLEAMAPLDIMKAGLSTMSGDTLLETGGMFYIDAQAGGQRVGIDPTKPLTVMVPSENADPGMKLYMGVKLADGRIDWRDPKPLRRSLVPVDITTLNFYPPGYEAKLAELGQVVTNKAFKDSLYYSFAGEWLMNLAGPDTTGQILASEMESIFSPPDSVFHAASFRDVIDPAKIKAIWNERFSGTNLATREFEERMRKIHGTCDNAVLDLYVNNLDKDLSEIDARVGGMGHKVFDHFAERNDGRVDLPAHAADRLRRVYEHWSRAEADAIRKTQEKFWGEQARFDRKSDQRRAERSMQDQRRQAENFQKEYTANLAEACRQLGIQKLGPTREPPISAYVANITNPGWWNVDRAVFQATADRKSMNFTDPNTGKTATLTYTPLTVEVADRTSYDELVAYLIPNQLNSYQRMKEEAGGFTERLNSIFNYDHFCLGMKGTRQFAFTMPIKGEGNITASLQEVDNNGLRRMLRTTGRIEQNMLDEARYFDWLAVDKQRRNTNLKRMELRNALMPVVFPCMENEMPIESLDSARVDTLRH